MGAECEVQGAGLTWEGKAPTEPKQVCEVSEGRALARPKKTARQRRALRKISEGEAPAEPKKKILFVAVFNSAPCPLHFAPNFGSPEVCPPEQRNFFGSLESRAPARPKILAHQRFALPKRIFRFIGRFALQMESLTAK